MPDAIQEGGLSTTTRYNNFALDNTSLHSDMIYVLEGYSPNIQLKQYCFEPITIRGPNQPVNWNTGLKYCVRWENYRTTQTSHPYVNLLINMDYPTSTTWQTVASNIPNNGYYAGYWGGIWKFIECAVQD